MNNSGNENSPTPPVEVWRLGDAELLDRLAEVDNALRNAESAVLAVLGEAEACGLADSLGYRSMVEVQYAHLTVSRAEAKRRMVRARALVSGSFPTAAEALRDGEISSAHLDQLVAFRASLSEAVEPAAWDLAEPELVGAAVKVDPPALRRFLAREVAPRLDPDGVLPTEPELAEPENGCRSTGAATGGCTSTGYSNPKPPRCSPRRSMPAPGHGPPPRRRGRTPRSLDRRRGDSMVEWVWLGREGIPLHADGGERPQVTVTIGLDALLSGLGAATMGPDQLPISVSEARRLACDCKIVPLVLDAESMPLDIGRATRTIPPHIRRAVTGRDKGCAFPGCDRPATQCQAHHVFEWQHGGATKLANFALPCPRHHRIVHHTAWEIRMNKGRPGFLPPSYLDPLRTPRINIVHGAGP